MLFFGWAAPNATGSRSAAFVWLANDLLSDKCLLYSRALHRFCMGQPNLKKYPCRAQRRSLRTGSSRALGGVLLGAGATVRRAAFSHDNLMSLLAKTVPAARVPPG